MDAEVLKKAGFKSEDELYLYQDVCCNEVPLEKEEFENMLEKTLIDIRRGVKRKKTGLFSKNLYMQYIQNNNLEDLYESLKNMTSVDRLIELYSYYFNKLSICIMARKNLELKLNAAIELFDGEKTEQYRELIRKTYFDEEKYRSIIVGYILVKKNERLKFVGEKDKFDKALIERNKSYSELDLLLNNMGGRQI